MFRRKPEIKPLNTEHEKLPDEYYYHREVYFSARPEDEKMPAAEPKAKLPVRAKKTKTAVRKRPEMNGAVWVSLLVVISLLLSFMVFSCMNDVFAFKKSSTQISVTVPEKATTGQMIKILSKAGLIRNKIFCRAFMNATLDLRGSDPEYLSGVYYLTPSMGLEKMLLSCQQVQKSETVTLTFPEGYNVDQIASKLAKNKVCSETEFYKNLNEATFNYPFLKGMKNKSERYRALEGYLYPDTYEFYVGESASSVIRKFLDNFSKHWTSEYTARAKELGMSVDEVVTLASIIQKEAGNTNQMATVSSIFHNRLNSPSFPSLQSDATNVYLNSYIKPNVTESQYDGYQLLYSTYYCTGLPVGAISNPGPSAIKAALYPSSTNYYFFCHDDEGNMYTASTEAQQSANLYKVALANAAAADGSNTGTEDAQD